MALDIFEGKDILKRPTNEKIGLLKSEEEYNSNKFVVTDIKQAIKNQNRANIFINGKYRFSLDIFQLTSLNVKIGAIFNKEELTKLEQQSEFGKLYSLALNYCLMRPHSEKEIRDYLWKKTLSKKVRNKKTGEFFERKGVSQESVNQTLARLKEKKYIDDEKFAVFWVENRNQRKGISMRKLQMELSNKGISREIQSKVLGATLRNDSEEIRKIIAKKSRRYPDKQKLIGYLMRQGFSFDEISKALEDY